ncbi:acyl-CoA dehydrogenase [Aquisalimonas asiatica]|uniref:Butyryl-CoA dehydrogenase n=1 Tax=Aquisalimonas asiatica TaxID=406100 RepID=A0A1H8R2L2_9GAMM|nr:acyl-CoA dehydrogenase [Aquisalimonas asiatica]SEO60394.1 butyryl-CoA dehydrogenase [Aquisalimonas asiatica]
MNEMLINSRDLRFQLYELLGVETLTQRERFAEHSRETFDAALETARQIAEEQFAPHNRKGDENEPVFRDGRAETIPETKTAWHAFAEAGFLAAHHDAEDGGMQMPTTIQQACHGYFFAANVSTAAYPFLTVAAGNLLSAHGSAEQKERWLPPMLDGRFSGTMALTEPHAGSSLGDLRTRAIPQDDGSYRIVGNKIYISGGEQDITDNIVHMVIARIEGAPAGVKGISLFIVPKYRLDADGNPAEPNDVTLAGLLHKMGYRGTTSTVLNFGDNGDCHGYLVGEANKGLAYMFHMMNEARIGVGVGAALLGYTGYLHSLDYARNRPQGRPVTAKGEGGQIPIIQHADVRRMLLEQKAYAEGGMALCLYAASLFDDTSTGPDAASRAEAQELLDLLTPVVKSWTAEYGCKANDLAIQVLGGAGYTRDYPVEQFYRDNRLNPIHEGTNGIQGMDLLGRKMHQNGGAGFKALLTRVSAAVEEARGHDETAPLAADLEQAMGTVTATARALGEAFGSAGPERVMANASVYLDLMGRFVVSWLWLRQATVAARALPDAHADDTAFYQGKLQAARYYLRWELPRIEHQSRLLQGLDDTCLAMREDWF